MTRSAWRLGAIAAIAAAGAAFAADPPAPSTTAPPGSAIKDCKNLSAAALKECEKVATEMDRSAQGKTPVPLKGTVPSTAAVPNGMHHSAATTQTPEEKAASKAVAKGQDPKKAVNAVRAKAHPKEVLPRPNPEAPN